MSVKERFEFLDLTYEKGHTFCDISNCCPFRFRFIHLRLQGCFNAGLISYVHSHEKRHRERIKGVKSRFVAGVWAGACGSQALV